MECLLAKLSITNKIPEKRVLPVFKSFRPNNRNKIEIKAIWRHYFGEMYFLEEVLLKNQLPDRYNDPVLIFSVVSSVQNDPTPKIKHCVENVIIIWSKRDF